LGKAQYFLLICEYWRKVRGREGGDRWRERHWTGILVKDYSIFTGGGKWFGKKKGRSLSGGGGGPVSIRKKKFRSLAGDRSASYRKGGIKHQERVSKEGTKDGAGAKMMRGGFREGVFMQ